MKRSDLAKAQPVKDRQAEVQEILPILHKWGIHTLGQFAALDKEELRARLGPEAVRLWERANGTATRLLNADPVALRHIEQWQFRAGPIFPSISYRTPPQRQLPVNIDCS